MEYNFRETEQKWQAFWQKNKTFRALNPDENGGEQKAPFYVLDMFPYPSGAGLHVGHPLGYIASDIFSRYKRHKGFNVLHPMGYDSFGLPAEQYAIQTGQHPSITTESNIKRYREQLDKLGFSFDWDREVRTSEPSYYKWTQWIFCQLFEAWYNPETDKAENLSSLIDKLKSGKVSLGEERTGKWDDLSEKEQSDVLMEHRLAYLSDTMVNWCPGLGTVLANEEVKDGFSERGGFPVERKLMQQWSLRISAYSERLLNDLESLEWSDAIKEMQRHWIGRSEGAMVDFKIHGSDEAIKVFTTRPDTIFGVTFVVIAPEHEWMESLTTPEQKQAVDEYVNMAKNRSERERMTEVKRVSGVFTGSYVEHPFTGALVPIWTGDYVLAGYGTGAVMAVPCGDQRDWDFATHFKLPIIKLVEESDITKEADATYEGTMINSDFLNGLSPREAIRTAIDKLEEKGIGKGRINYRLRDAIFSRQRYWGEPIPVYYKNGIPHLVKEEHLPVVLPEVDKYLPTESGEPPLARAKNWFYDETKGAVNTAAEEGRGGAFETNTMPGWAGSSWYYLRYMDAGNASEFVSKQAADYWGSVDLYIGGAEHATGHLLYVRFWTKFLFDLGFISIQEPAKKLVNQGMIQGRSNFVYRKNTKGKQLFISKNLLSNYKPDEYTALHVDVNIVKNDILDVNKFRSWREEYASAEFELEDGKYHCGFETEKMSKSKWNVVSPDDLVQDYGADTLRMYEMFLGPLEQHKPWNTNGIEGVYKFLRKFWRMMVDDSGNIKLSNHAPSKDELRILHRTIKKISEDIERMSFNTSVSNFMICLNELQELKSANREVFEALVVLISPFAPHIAEELWEKLGHTESVEYAAYPLCNEKHLVEDSFTYPVSFNGKTRFNISLPADLTAAQIEKSILEMEEVVKWMEGKTPKKVIVVPKRIVNIVI